MRFGSVVSLAMLAAFGGCSSSSTQVSLAPTLIFPAGLLDNVTSLNVSVFEQANATCTNPDTQGTVGGNLDPKSALASGDLAAKDCAAGVKFCGKLQIPPDGQKTRVFVAKAKQGNDTIAQGCNTLVVNGDKPITIKMFRLIPQAMCAGKPSPYKVVQCDTPGSATDPVCDAECLSKDQFLSIGSGGAGQTSSAKVKEKASFVWPASADPGVGRFMSFAGDQSLGGRYQVSMRVLDPSMNPCVGAACSPDRGSFVQMYSFFIPNDPNNIDLASQSGDPQTQYNPAAVTAAGKYFIAFEDGNGNTTRIAMRTMAPSIAAEQPVAQPIGLTGNQGQKRPAMAVGAGKILVVWEANGEIRGRSVDPNSCGATCTALGTEQLIGSGSRPSVAAAGSGFVVAWQSGADVKIKATDGEGAGGTETKVNDATHSGNQDSPAVAALSSGAVGVLWHDSGNGGIFVQRYGAAPGLTPVANDQAKRINDQTPSDPSDEPNLVAGGGAGGAFFAAAWIDRTSGHVRARFLDGTGGFLYNPVDGQVSEFQASRTDPAAPTSRHNPAIAIGGAAPYVAIGWDDNETDPNNKGIYARRFPVPLK